MNILGGTAGLVPGKSDKKKADKKNKTSSSKEVSRFSSTVDQALLKSQESISDIGVIETEEQLTQILDNIYIMGENLKKSPTFSQIQEYKGYIKQFLNYIVTNGFIAEGKVGILKKDLNRKQFTNIRTIDKKLDNLAAGVLQDQRQQLDVLAKIDEIYGLVVDLFS